MSAAPAAKPATTPASAAAAAAPKRLFMGSQLPLIKFVVLGGVWTHLFMSNCYTVRKTIGPSMLPTLNVRGDWVLISKLNKLGRGLRVGDLVSYKHPVEADIGVIKRVIGMPGDFVVKDPTDGSGDMLQVPPGHMWVTGDNLPHSTDSRVYGPIPLAMVSGKVVARLWPRPSCWIKNPLADE